MTYEIIKLHEDDWRKYREIRLRCLKNEFRIFGSSYEEEASQPEEFMRAKLCDTSTVACKMNENFIGIATISINKGERRQHKAIVQGVYVDEAHRRKGILQKLMAALIENLPPYVEQLLLDVSVENTAAINAYKKLGFEIFGTEPRARKIGDHYHDEHLMIKFVK